jgi:diacylglycerol O-acyltransferase
MDRLSPVDASFLHQERRASHMHVGALVIFEGPPPSREEFVEHMESRLSLVPRYRQKLAFPRFEMGRPFWIDDPQFNIDYHVRHTALPSPGSVEQLRQLVGRIFSQRLDRSKPLWEVWLVQGLAPDDTVEGGKARFALISKTHHALVDGVSGVDVSTVLFDLEPVPQPAPATEDGWTPTSEPSQAQLVAEGVKGLLRTPVDLAGGALGAVQRPTETAGRAREALEGVGEVVWGGLNPAPDVPLNVPIGPHRRLRWVQRRLDDFKEIKNALGGTVNDVVLAVVAGALGRWLRARGVRTEGLELRALVPVSIRAEHERGALGNRIAVMRGPLPVYARDPVERLRIVREAMQGLKESKQALGAQVISSLENFAPPTLLAMASRVNFSTRLFNLIVTNVPGPQFPLYLLGREMSELVPVAFLPEDHALAIAIMSYNGKVDFGLLGDYDAMPDLDHLGELIEESLEELLEVARDSAPRESPRSAGSRGGSRSKRPASAKGSDGKGGGKRGTAAKGAKRSARAARNAPGGERG